MTTDDDHALTPRGTRPRTSPRSDAARAPVGPVLCTPAVEVPEHVITLDETLELAARIHPGHEALPLALRLIKNTGVRTRHLVQPIEVTLDHPGLEERNKTYVREAKRRIPAAVDTALANARLIAREIDAIVLVSCTGFTMPSLTAWMINELGFRTDTRQIPIAQMGCAGGGSAINRAHDFFLAHPGANVLIVACEFCSLCYQPTDLTIGNLLSNGLFGDAVASAVVRGRGGRGMRLEANGSHLVPGTEEWISYAVKPTGFHFLLDRRVPHTMQDLAPALVEIGGAHGWDVTDLDFYVIHAGGPRILDDLSRHLGVKPAMFERSRDTLTQYGNIASAVVLDALRRTAESGLVPEGARGLLAGFGPGITAEITLGTWTNG
ncbi:type III polyketide synthase [Streptomyces sp. FIT100]|uniref:type III polyketide synthase n=1 Tax=Streptomyces sp. FIT100 TaxID=2837956 RepID=UPI0021C92DC7|nr:type III polyketide synthase [Streptomyces sp. FIT100]UUN25266.1 type III polyketide synthase [Streptomyces sp. FIT100]